MLEIQLHAPLLHLTTFLAALALCNCALYQQLGLIGLCLLLLLLFGTGRELKLPIPAVKASLAL
eukprot:1157032-Pelagomonas_calceolata.AAC.2